MLTPHISSIILVSSTDQHFHILHASMLEIRLQYPSFLHIIQKPSSLSISNEPVPHFLVSTVFYFFFHSLFCLYRAIFNMYPGTENNGQFNIVDNEYPSGYENDRPYLPDSLTRLLPAPRICFLFQRDITVTCKKLDTVFEPELFNGISHRFVSLSTGYCQHLPYSRSPRHYSCLQF